jgi:hypothetical protein
MQLLRGNSLKTSEESVGRRVGAGEEDTQPTQVSSENGYMTPAPVNARPRTASVPEYRVRESESQHSAMTTTGVFHGVQCVQRLFPLRPAHFEDQTRQDRRDEYAGPCG